MEDECTVIRDVDFVTSTIFEKDDYLEAIKSLGLKVMFYGAELLDLYHASTQMTVRPPNDCAYIALDLAAIDSSEPLPSDLYSQGFPYLNLLLKSLRPWNWCGDKHVLHIPSCNVELNIGAYSLRRLSFEADIPGDHQLVANWPYRSKLGVRYKTAICFGQDDLPFGVECIGSDDGNWPQVDARTTAEARWQQFKKTVSDLFSYTKKICYQKIF